MRTTLVIRRLLLALVAVVVCLAWSTAPAAAHAYLDSSNPGDGASVANPPHRLRLAFSEHVVLEATEVRLYDGRGRAFPLTGLRLVTDNPGETEQPAEIVVDLPRLAQGAYRVSWSTLSSDDLHRTSGIIVFGVRATVHSGGLQEPAPDRLEVVVGGAVLGGLALALGGPTAVWVLAGVPGLDRARRRVLRAAALGAGIACTAALVMPMREVLAGDAANLLAGSYVLRWGVREAGLVVLLVLLSRPRPQRWALASASLVAATGQALLGHAVARAGGDPLRLPVTALHLWAALAWAGGVAGLAIALMAARHGPVGTLRTALRRFAVPAGTCAAVVVATGLYLVGDVVVSVDAALSTTYGRTLLVKLGVVGVVGALGLVNHRRLRGLRDLDLPRRTIVAEALVASAVVAVTAVLVAAQPATEPQLVKAGPPVSEGPSARQVADLQESVALRPNLPGASVVVVDVFDTRRPARGPVSDVSLRLGGRSVGSARSIGDGRWLLPVEGLRAGPVDVTVAVTRPGMTPVVATYPWVVAPSTPPPAEIVSRAPIGPLLRWASGLVAAFLLPLGGWLLRRRRSAPLAGALKPVERSTAGRF